MAPELTLQRGKEYTFVVETGLGTDPKGTFHPFYITDDVFGGRQIKAELEAKSEHVYAGVTLGRQGGIVPSAMGKLCRWNSPRPMMTYASYKDFHRDLVLNCEAEPPSMASLLRSTHVNNPSILKFVPDNTMPDELYYQSFMAKRLGGKIHLTDYCYNSNSVSKDLTTYRPDIMKHFANQHPQRRPNSVRRRKRPNSGEVFAPSESRREPNRRIDYDDDAYDYDINDFDNDNAGMDLYYKCKRKALMRGRSLKISNEEMPSFEHFPKRDIMKTSGISEDKMPSDEDCEGILNQQSTELREKENVFESLLNARRKAQNDQTIALSRSRGTARPIHRTTKLPPTTPFPFTKMKSPEPTHFTTTTIRPKPKVTEPWNRNTARPGYSQFQLDPSLLHNGFLFDKRQMEEYEEKRKRSSSKKNLSYTTAHPGFLLDQQRNQQKSLATNRPSYLDQRQQIHSTVRPKYLDQRQSIISTVRPKFSSIDTIPISDKYSIAKKTSTQLPKLKSKKTTETPNVPKYVFTTPKLTTTTMPTLPPPGGDVPSYMAMLNEARQKYEDTKQSSKDIPQPPILKKIPIAVTPIPSKNQPPMQTNNRDPFSMLSNMFIPKWFNNQEQDSTPTKTRPIQKPQQPNKLPMLPPPRDFPSFEQAKKKPMPQIRRKSQSRPKNAKPQPGNFQNIMRNEPSDPYRNRPLQFTPMHEGSSGIPYQGNHPRRRLKLPETKVKKKKGFLEQILSLPERLPRVPFLGSSVSIPSIDTGNSTIIDLTGK